MASAIPEITDVTEKCMRSGAIRVAIDRNTAGCAAGSSGGEATRLAPGFPGVAIGGPLFMLAASLSGCSSIDSIASRDNVQDSGFVTVALKATTYNAGHIGRAYLIPSGDRTVVRIEASGVPDTVTRPIHLYTYIYGGSCSAHGGEPEFTLTGVVLANSVAHPASIGAFAGALTISNFAPVGSDVLRAKAHAIVVKTAPADGDHDLFCGEIRGQPAP